MKLPKINFKVDRQQKEKKGKIYCQNCEIRVGTFRNKAVEYKDGYYCGSCHFKRVKNPDRRSTENETNNEHNTTDI